MTKKIVIHGQRVKLYSSDEGHTWTSSPQAPVGSDPIKTLQRLELQKQFERIDGRRNRDPNEIAEFDIPMSFIRR
jgi:hypothetical protein